MLILAPVFNSNFDQRIIKKPTLSTRQEIELPDKNLLTVGREEGCDLEINSKSVSRRHATITIKNAKEAYIQDGDGTNPSSNGTFVNNQRVTGSKRLLQGDEIRFAGVLFTLRGLRQRNSETLTTLNGEGPVS